MTDQAGQPAPSQRLLTFQNVTLLVFAGLTVTIVVIAIASLFVPSPASDTFLVTRTLSVLVTLAVACVLMAWLDQSNARALGQGLRQLLSVNRAAIAAFIAAGAATIGVCLFVALAALFSGRVQHGLYILAAIQFLLKLAAVSAIIVLITLRRAPIYVSGPNPNAAPGGAETPEAVAEAPDDRGRLEFGSLAFAFGLVVIAGLVIPNEDLMRLSSMFFGGDKKIEDHLPRQPILALDDDLGERIANSVILSPAMSSIFEKIGYENQDSIENAISITVRSVMYEAAIDNARRTGTFDIFEKICQGTQEDVVFANSTNRILADHLSYLVSEGLIKIVYEDLTSMAVTDYGNDVMYKYANVNCVGHEENLNTISDTAQSLTVGSRIMISISDTPKSFGLNLPPGTYYAALVAQDDSDPILQLLDRDGRLLQEDDDSGAGSFDSLLFFTVDEASQGLVLRAKTFDGLTGNAELIIEESSAALPQAATPRPSPRFDNGAFSPMTPEDIARNMPPTNMSSGFISGVAVPPEGAVITFNPEESRDYSVGVEPSGLNAAYDLIGTLFRTSGGELERVAFDDDSGTDNLPLITASLNAGETYFLVLQHYSMAPSPAIVDIRVEAATPQTPPEPPVFPDTPEAQNTSAPPAEQGEPDLPADQPEAAAPTGSDGSQSDP